jgi:hypothetical protein
LIVSVKSTEVVSPDGAGEAGCFVVEVFAAAGAADGAGFAVSGLAARLEITNRRRTGGVFNGVAFGLLLLGRGALFGGVALRFDINYQTKKLCAGSEKIDDRPRNAASDEIPGFIAVKLEPRTPED